MDKDTILNYVTKTPGNTNRAVLSSMLNSIEGGGSGSNCELIKAYVEITMDEGPSAFWYQEESKRFADIVEELGKGNIVIIIGIYYNQFWGIFELKEQSDSSLKFDNDGYLLTINSNDTMTLVRK